MHSHPEGCITRGIISPRAEAPWAGIRKKGNLRGCVAHIISTTGEQDEGCSGRESFPKSRRTAGTRGPQQPCPSMRACTALQASFAVLNRNQDISI